MWIFYLGLGLFIILTVYFFIFPLSKNRPVLVKTRGLTVYLLILALAMFPLLKLWFFAVAVFIISLFWGIKPWFVYGVTDTMIFEALKKASLATRAPIEKILGAYKVDASIAVNERSLSEKTHLIFFKTLKQSKKAELSVEVFKKYLLNYFISNNSKVDAQ